MGSAPLCGAKPANVVESIPNINHSNTKQQGSSFLSAHSVQNTTKDLTEELLSPENASLAQDQTLNVRNNHMCSAENRNDSGEILENTEKTLVYSEKSHGSSEHFVEPFEGLTKGTEELSENQTNNCLRASLGIDKDINNGTSSKMMSISAHKAKEVTLEDETYIEMKEEKMKKPVMAVQREHSEPEKIMFRSESRNEPVLKCAYKGPVHEEEMKKPLPISACREHYEPKALILHSEHKIEPDGKDEYEEDEDEEDEDDDGTEAADDGKKKKKPMTEEELDELKTKTYTHLKQTAIDALAVEDTINEDRVYQMSIRNAILRVYNSYFTLKRGSLQQRIQFRLGIANILLETKFVDLICDCLIRMYRRGWVAEDGKTDKKAYSPMINAVLTVVNFSDASDAISIEVANHYDYMETIKDILLKYARRHLHTQEPKLSKEEAKLMKFSLSVAHNVSMRTNNIHRLRSLDFTNVMQPYLNSTDEMLSLTALATLAGIVNEAECDIINAAHDRVKYLLKVLQKGLATKLRRFNGWSCKECGYTVRMLAQNDANKKLLVELGALELLVKMGQTGNEEEQSESVQAIWALCFDKDNQQKVVQDESRGVIELLFELKQSENADTKKACNGALWTLRDALKTSKCQKYREFALKLEEDTSVRAQSEAVKRHSRQKPGAEEAKDDRGHVMISYQWADQEMLKRIRDQLKLNGYRVWMDIDEMGGSTLQAMASAVENAEIVLMCLSQKYKNSPNCRAEAEYAFQKGKKIIPLKTERGYVPDGWLGFICGAKLFYEFSGKYPFEDKMKGLLKEMGKHWNNNQEQTEPVIKPELDKPVRSEPARTVDHVDSGAASGTVGRVSISMATVESVRKWTASDLKQWIDKNDLKSVLPDRITAGEIALLLQMKMDSPDFFYKCLHDMMRLYDLLSMSKLVWALQDIGKH